MTKAKGKLVLKQINTSRLEYMIQLAQKALDNGDKYKQDEAWDIFVTRLNEAKEALAKLESQEAVDRATQELSDAYGDLRIKPDESIIEDLKKFLEEIKDLDYGNYSMATQKRIKEAVAAVEKVLNNKESSQKELLETSKLVNEARELIKHPDVKDTSKVTGVVTGDDTNVMMMGILLISGMAVAVYMKKRKEN